MGTVLITGGHKGIGLAANTRLLEQGGCDLIMAGRTQAEMDAVARDLAAHYRANIRTVVLDVASLASVRTAVGAAKALLREKAVAPCRC